MKDYGEDSKNCDNRYATYSDEELVERAQGGDERALEKILQRYKPLALSLAEKYFIKGQDRDDIIQEVMIALFKAIQAFDVKKDTSFAAFAKVSAKRQVIDSIRHSEKNSNKILNEAVYVDNLNELQANQLTSENIDPYLEQKLKLLLQNAKSQYDFSDMEWNVLLQRVKGKKYEEIAQELQVSFKAVDNAIQRIKKKLKRVK